MLEILCKTSGGVSIVEPVGHIDATSAAKFENTCLEAVRAGVKTLILDFRGVQYISSAGIRSVLVIGKSLREADGALRLANVGSMVAKVFELAGVMELFPAYDSVAAAMA